MGVPILIFALAFAAGSVAPARWLPELAEGRAGDLILLIVCGLLGISLALIALHVYELIRQLQQAQSLGVGSEKPDTVANAILTMLRDVGPVLGLAAVSYILGPAREAAREEEAVDFGAG